MKIFFDTEFHEYHKQQKICGIPVGKKIPTIDLISIGLVNEKDETFYMICNEFNIEDAWHSNQGTKKEPDYWLRTNVLKAIYAELLIPENNERTKRRLETLSQVMTLPNLKFLINRYGKSKQELREGIHDFVYGEYLKGSNLNYEERIKYSHPDFDPEFWAYYADYDWVVLAQLFGKMIDLPKGFPFYCRDLQQTFVDKADNLSSYTLNKLECPSCTHTPLSFLEGEKLLTSRLRQNLLKKHPLYPVQFNEHNALDDAKWDKALYKFLNNFK